MGFIRIIEIIVIEIFRKKQNIISSNNKKVNITLIKVLDEQLISENNVNSVDGFINNKKSSYQKFDIFI